MTVLLVLFVVLCVLQLASAVLLGVLLSRMLHEIESQLAGLSAAMQCLGEHLGGKGLSERMERLEDSVFAYRLHRGQADRAKETIRAMRAGREEGRRIAVARANRPAR